MAEMPVMQVTVESAPVPIPSPDNGDGGFRGWLGSHFRPFFNSLYSFISTPEFNKVAQTALASGSLATAATTILWALSPFLQAQAGPFLAPFVGAAVGWITVHMGVRAKLGTSTDSAGNHAPAVVTTDRTAS